MKSYPVDINSDPRWRRLKDKSFICSCCNEPIGGLTDIGYDHPDPWPHGALRDTGEDILRVGEDQLGTDICILDGNAYIRGVLPLPIIGTTQRFCFGVWASLSKERFEKYIEADVAEGFSQFNGCFGWVMNGLPYFDFPDPFPADIEWGKDPSVRPEIWVHQGAHPVTALQHSGITLDQLLDIYAASGMDIRPHLLDS